MKRGGKDSDAERVRLLIRAGEGLTVEFKERYTPRIDEDLAAFSNGRGGTLLLGVRDDGAVAGERLTNELKARINDLARNCKPSISVVVAQVGKVIAVEVPEGTEKPYSCGRGYYRRLDGNTQKMSHDELRTMFAGNEAMPFEEKTVKGFTFDHVSKARVRAFAKEAGISLGRTPVPDFLRSLKVANEKHVKNAGILFFAEDVYEHIHHAETTLLAFKGTDRLHIYDRRDVRDDLLTQFNEVVIFLQKHLNVRSEIRGVDRHDIFEIPLEALREALVNALMHRDYSIRGTQVSVEVYDDRVEIVNPGGLPKGLSKDDFGRISVRRNELIADLFFRLHKVERVGSGIKRMRQEMVRAGLRKPEFEVDAFFRAVFQRPEGFTVPDVGRTTQKTAQKTAQKIIDLISREPEITRQRLAEAIGITDSGVKYQLRQLQEKGLIRRVGPDKGGHWEVIE